MSEWVPAAIRPLARRIPILMISMLVLSLATTGWLGYLRVNSFAEEAERSRLESSANQLLANIEGNLSRLRAETGRLAAEPPIGRAASPLASSAERDAARKRLAELRRTSAQYIAVALWSADGTLIEADGHREIAERQPPQRVESRDARNLGLVVNRLSSLNDTILYSASTPIIGADSTAIGYLVTTRRLISSAEGIALFGRLVGPNARILFANAGETRSLDLARGVPGPEIPAAAGAGEYMQGDGISRFYFRRDVAGTPWVMVLDEPRHLAVAPARKFALGMLGVAALFILVAGTLVWLIMRRSLLPLKNVTQAVIGFTHGDGTVELRDAGDDEIAQFGRAYNAMVDKVASRTDALLESINEHQESETRYRALIDHLPDGIMAHRNRVIAFANPACARLFGEEDPQSLIGRSIMDFVEPADHDLTLERLGQVDVGAQVPTREMRLRRVDGKRVIVESTNMGLTLDGKPAIQTILHDVTDRHVLEDRLRQSQKMEAVGRLAGGIAHDFNNLLTVIDAHAEFAMREDAPQEERAMDIEEIRRASASAARLTRQLLTFSRKQTATPERIDLTDAVRDVLVMLNRLIGDDVQIETHLARELWSVYADPSHMEQVLLNLALNARDAMPAGGRLTFSTENVEVGPDYRSATGEVIPEGNYVVLRVEDTGIGMAPEVESRAFEPFFTTKGPGRGTGLGLSTVYGIVKQSGGYIWLYTEPGRGTVFKIMLPRHGTTDSPVMAPRVSEQNMTAIVGHVLLVEDQPYVRAAISRSLKKAGFIVTDVRDAELASEAIAAQREIDIVVTDMVMPGKSGAHLATELSLSHPGLPVIIMSGYSEEMADRQWRLPENARFIEKPVSPTNLIRVINELLVNAQSAA